MTDLNALSFPALFQTLMSDGLVRRLFEIARDEDLGPRGTEGDVTSESILLPDARASARVVARAPGALSGLAAVPALLDVFGVSVGFAPSVADGSRVSKNQAIATLSGPARDLLALERTLLNVLSRCSGVATLARRYVDAVAASDARICETRKTIPGWRALDKYAARCGGAYLHRLALHDAALYKDNHLAGIAVADLAQRVATAADAARRAGSSSAGGLRFVEVEVDTLDQLDALLTLPRGVIDIVLLDNMPVDQLRQAVGMRNAKNPSLQLEASGGVTLDTVLAIAQTGVNRISVGEITHSAPALDLGLDFE